MYKLIYVILPKVLPPKSLEKDLRSISLTPVVSKELEAIVCSWKWDIIKTRINKHQFASIPGSSIVCALIDLVHNWHQATDKIGHYIRVLLVDYSKAFDHIDY